MLSHGHKLRLDGAQHQPLLSRRRSRRAACIASFGDMCNPDTEGQRDFDMKLGGSPVNREKNATALCALTCVCVKTLNIANNTSVHSQLSDRPAHPCSFPLPHHHVNKDFSQEES